MPQELDLQVEHTIYSMFILNTNFDFPEMKEIPILFLNYRTMALSRVGDQKKINRDQKKIKLGIKKKLK